MTALFVFQLGLLAQATASPTKAPSRHPGAPPPHAPAVRVWLSDSTYSVGSPARVYVQLREPGYLVVLHVDPAGFIRVLFPSSPAFQGIAPAGTYEVGGSDAGEAFVVAARGGGTILAARSPSPWRFDDLRSRDRWDYENALLLQPTAGDQFAALLDITDRMASGARYVYDLAPYRGFGTGSARELAAADEACAECGSPLRYVRHEPYAEPQPVPANVATDVNYAPSAQSYTVNCAGASLVDSFCGVQDNRVWNTYQVQSNSYVEPDYAPYFVPFIERRRDSTPPPPPPARTLLTQGLRPPRTRVIPPAPIPPPRIVVQQPRVISRPSVPSTASGVGAAQARTVSTVPVNPNAGLAVGQAMPGLRPVAGAAGATVPMSASVPLGADVAPRVGALPAFNLGPRMTGAITTRGFVPSRGLLRTMATARR